MTQLTLAPIATLPLHPEEMAGLTPAERGKFYNRLDLDSWQRACIEQALRLVLAGIYGGGARHP